MRLYCLSGHPNQPCFILKFKQTTLMLDCGLDITSCLNYLPLTIVPSGKFSKLRSWNGKAGSAENEIKECGGQYFIDGAPEFSVPEVGMVDLSEVDAVLVSNHRSMLALPYITEHPGFRGQVYATEPTLNIGRLFMEELVEYVERCPKQTKATKWKQPSVLSQLPAPLKTVTYPRCWRQLYNEEKVNSSLAKVKMVSFNEKHDIFGALKVTAVSSGYCIGSCNWVIQSDYEKISYLSGSSTLTTHPRPMEQAPLRNSDILVLSSLTQTPTTNPDNMIGEFCVNTAMTLKAGGNVLVPCYPSGVTYDLFECLSGHLDSCGLSHIPMYFISPVANSSLAYSNIYAEWLSSSKQSKIYLPEPPFPHAELVKNFRLKHYASIYAEGFNTDMVTPCIVFTGHPSLRFGDIVHFMELWGKSNLNSVIFTDPDFQHTEALAPYQPLAMKAFFCPIDTGLSFSQANKLIKDLKPLHLVMPEQYSAPPITIPHRNDLIIECDPPALLYKRTDVHSLPVKRRFEKVEISEELASSIVPTEVKPGIAVAMVSGSLITKDNNYILQPVSEPTEKKRKLGAADTKKPSYVWGSLDIDRFVQSLAAEGITDVKVEESPSGHIVHLPSDDTLIQIEDGSTHIICQGNESLRVKLRDTLLKCLQKL